MPPNRFAKMPRQSLRRERRVVRKGSAALSCLSARDLTALNRTACDPQCVAAAMVGAAAAVLAEGAAEFARHELPARLACPLD